MMKHTTTPVGSAISIPRLQCTALPRLSQLNVASLNLQHARTSTASSSRSSSPSQSFTDSLHDSNPDVKLVQSSFDEADVFVYFPSPTSPTTPSPTSPESENSSKAFLITGPAALKLRRTSKSIDLKGARLKPYRLTSRPERYASSSSSRRTSMFSTTSQDSV